LLSIERRIQRLEFIFIFYLKDLSLTFAKRIRL